MQTNIQTFPLSSLHLSALNVRQVTDPARVSDLVASIGETGHLIENLCVTLETVGKKKKPTPGVVVGGRRLLALQILAENGKIAHDTPIPCKVVEQSEAVELSLAENVQREGMTPIEQFRAFARLAENGMPVEDIAARFNVTPLVVSRRLKLAAVSPKLIELAEAGEVNMEQLMALSVVDDHETQEQCWESARGWERNANQLRERLLGHKPEADRDARMKLVGLDAYRAAGGTLTTDLFADEDNAGYINDTDLLDSLVKQQLDAAAAAAESAGWTPVVIEGVTNQWEATRGYHQLYAVSRDMTEDEQKQAEALEARIEELDQQITAIEDDENDEGGENYEKLTDERERVDAELDALRESLQCFTDAQKADGKAIIFLTHQGQIVTAAGYSSTKHMRPDTHSGSGTGSSTPPPAAFHSDRLATALSCARTMAVQAELVQSPETAYLALIANLAEQVIVSGYAERQIKISVTNGSRETVGQMVDGDTAEAVQIVTGAKDRWIARWESYSKDNSKATAFGWVLDLNEDMRADLLAVCVAVSFDARSSRDHVARPSPLTQHIGLDMHRWWNPNAASYFNHLSKPQILKVLTENGCDTTGLDKLRKTELAVKAEELMADSQWLPSPLRD